MRVRENPDNVDLVSEFGRYRIQTVAEMTGVSAATLRAWERRYGIPAPQRSASAYRLYTDQDVETIRRVRELCAGGIAPAQAVQMIHTSRDGREELVRLEGDTTELAVHTILAGVDRFDVRMVEAAVRQAMYCSTAATLFDGVFGPVLAEIGNRWNAGTLSIGQEHMVSEIIGSALRDMLRLMRPCTPRRTVVLACFADDEHVLPLLGASLALTGWNMRVLVLGSRTPPAAIRHAVAEVRPDLVGLSVTLPMEPGHAASLIEEYAAACGRTPWLVGGQGSDALRGPIEACGGTVAPCDRTQLRATIDRLTSARPNDALSWPAHAG